MLCGIYRIETPSGYYIGQSIELNNRKMKHFSYLRNNRHPNKHLQNVANKYGVDAFEFVVICYVEPEELDEYEQCLLDKFFDDPKCLNKARDVLTPTRGVPMSEEQKQKISNTLTGRKCSPRSDETRLKLSIANKGKKASQETKDKIGAAFSKSVRGIHVDGTEIVWRSLTEAARYFNYSDHTTMNHFLLREPSPKSGKCKGWRFQYE